MKTWVIIPVVAMAIVGLLALFGAQWFFLNTFGPKGRSLRLELPDRKVLLCEEKTSAEVAGMHYEVDFRLIDKLDTLLLGHAVFADHDWDKSITLFSTGHWHILPVRENSFLRLLLVNKKTRIRRDTTLTPEAMRRQVFASAGNLEPVYSGRSNLTRFSGIDFIVVMNIASVTICRPPIAGMRSSTGSIPRPGGSPHSGFTTLFQTNSSPDPIA